MGEPRFATAAIDGKYVTGRIAASLGDTIVRELERRGLRGRLLDVGCGRGETLSLLAERLPGRFDLHGIDRFFEPSADWPREAKFVRKDLNRSFAAAGPKFDVVICTEVIEHIVDTDDFITQLRSLLRPGGVLILSTPNLASAFNRFMLLFGLQPLCTEVSWKNPYLGREWIYDLLRLRREPAAGHLRLFTTAGLRAFLRFHRFDVHLVRGFSIWGGFLGAVSRVFSLFPSLMPGNLVVATRGAALERRRRR